MAKEQGLHDSLLQGSTSASLRRGYSLLALVIISWVGQSELAQYIQTVLRYNKPWAVTWLNHSAMALLAPALWLRQPGLLAHIEAGCGIRLPRFLSYTAALAVLYTAGDYAWYLALPLTTVADGTALFNCQSVFAYALSVMLLGEALVPLKVLAVVMSVGGVVCISAGAPGEASEPSSLGVRARVLGDVLILGAALAYASYEVGLKRMLGDASGNVVNATTAAVGVNSLALGLPGFVLLDWARVEPLDVPSAAIAAWLGLNAALALVFNVSFVLALAALSPVTVAVGCMLTIPLASLVDWVGHGSVFSAGDVLGAVLIISGFVLLAAADTWCRHHGSIH